MALTRPFVAPRFAVAGPTPLLVYFLGPLVFGLAAPRVLRPPAASFGAGVIVFLLGSSHAPGFGASPRISPAGTFA